MISGASAEQLAHLTGPVAVTVGVFDGVHRGHARILDALTTWATEHDAASIVVTLDPHPLRVLRPEIAPPVLSTPEERIRLLEFHRPDAVLVFPFDTATAGLEAASFLDRVVPPGGDLVALVVGHDFRMGKGRGSGEAELAALGQELGFSVTAVEAEGGEAPVSSTRIRRLVAEGRMSEASDLLGHPYLVRGRVVPGRGIGRTLSFPTANVDVGGEGKLLPEHGVYAVQVDLGEGGGKRAGVMNLGTRPTFGATEPTLEVHLPGFEGDLLGTTLDVWIVERIREERTFDGPEELARRIRADVDDARKILERRQI